MSLIEIEFMKTNEKFIKYEDEHKVELDEDSTEFDKSNDDSYTARCGEIFVSNSGKFSFVCTFCDEKFIEINIFMAHMQKDHLNTQDIQEDPLHVDGEDDNIHEIKPEICLSDEDEVVDVDTNSFKENLENTNSGSEETNFLKDFCSFLVKNAGQKNIEKQSNLEGTNKFRRDQEHDDDLLCDTCNKRFNTKKGYEKHKLRHEAAEYSDDVFGDADEQSYSEDEIEIKVSNPKLKQVLSPLKCKYCHQQFKDRSRRISHERIHTGEKPFKCEDCGKCFRTKRLLGNHTMTHRGERPHKCPYCGAAFTHKMNLIVHIRAHLGDKRFRCEICDKRFVRNVDRRIHMRSHTGEKPYQCEWCGNSFSTSSKLTEHRKRHTNTRPYKCEDCGKCFYSGNLLKNHAVVHSNARPFQCEICLTTFPRKRALQSHIKIHSEVKEYVCTICDKAFAQNAGLYCHMKSHGVRITKKLPTEFSESFSLT